MGYLPDLLASNMSEVVGSCIITVDNTDIHVSFDGKGSFVKSIRTPLDTENVTLDADGNATNTQIGKRWRVKGYIDVTDEFNKKR